MGFQLEKLYFWAAVANCDLVVQWLYECLIANLMMKSEDQFVAVFILLPWSQSSELMIGGMEIACGAK